MPTTTTRSNNQDIIDLSDGAPPQRRTNGSGPIERRAIHAYLTVENHEVWHTVSEEAGVSLSGFLEALADDFREFPPDEEDGHPRWKVLIKRARKIDADRRKRGA